MFNNCDSKTNGETKFFMNIKDNINVIFDVGCRSESEFINFSGEVHYFDPVNEFIENLKKQTILNKKSYARLTLLELAIAFALWKPVPYLQQSVGEL